MSRLRFQSLFDLVLITLFLAFLWLPLADTLLALDPVPSLNENRPLVERPRAPASAAELARIPARFEDYFDDHFGFRSALLRAHAWISVRGFGLSSSSLVAIGKEGWLYMATEELESHKADRPFRTEDLLAWQDTLEARRDWLALRDCRYLVVIAPDKSTIYPEFVPDQARRIGQRSRLDQLVAHMRAHSDVALLDLRPALLAAKAEEPVYFRTDTHWNGSGAFVAYREILAALGRWFPQLAPLPRSAFTTQRIETGAMILGEMIGAEELFPETRIYLKANFPRRARPAAAELPPGLAQLPFGGRLHATEVADPALPRVLMFCDSFSTFFSGFLAENCGRLVRYRSSNLLPPPTLFEPAMVEAERPQVVLSEFAERFLLGPPPEHSLPGAD